MAKFDAEQTIAVASITQLLNDWAYELDINHNKNVRKNVTDDCEYNVAGSVKKGVAAVEGFYADRVKSITGAGKPMPTVRHINSNYRFEFVSKDEVKTTFNLIYWANDIPGLNPADVVAVADVWMTCRRGADGDWKISKFDSTQPLKRG
jgi:hypothetical protein